MNTTQLSAGIAFGVLVLAFAAVTDVRAQSSDDALAAIQFPVAELGNCGSKEECKTYCDEPDNIEACISFAEENNLMPAKEIEHAKKFLAAGAKGPGGCTSKNSCESYCNNPDNIETCVTYAEENGLMDGEELAEARKVRDAIRKGVKPPPCGGKKECDAYCESPENMPACIEFASAAGLMSEEEQRNAQQMLQAIKAGAKPPACRGKEKCDAYCSQDEHFDECMEFGKAAGFMNEKEYEMAKKTRGKGPGGCRGKEECDAFCTNSPENEEICFNFGKENGLIPPEQLRQMEEGNQKFRESFSNMPPEVASCLSEKFGADRFEKFKNGEIRPSRDIGDAMGTCFQQFEEQRRQNEGQQQQMMQRPGEEGGPPGEFNGPRTPEGAFRPPESFQCEGENCKPPEGISGGPVPEGMMGPPSQEQIEEYKRQMTEQYQRQMTEEYQRQMIEGGGSGEPGQPVPPQFGSPPEGAYMMPSESGGGFGEFVPSGESAPAPAPAPASESFAGAAILFFQSLLLGK